jgi:hypothetical protein
MDCINSLDKKLSESRLQNIEMLKIIQLTSQELLKLKGNDDFYDNPENADKFISIISGDSQISIRLIDHFITKFSKYNKCSYKLNENDKETIFNVYFDYKNQLKHFQKTHFDPFSRGDRIPFFMKNTCIITTIGQLNFFRWFISKKIFEYLMTKKDDVFDDMNKKNKIEKKNINKISKQIKIKEKMTLENPKKPLMIVNNIDKKIVKILVSFE